ncbi:MAG: ribosome maturation factor RimP [Cyclobacteriaceae bacterium]|nr:ribosome maturation factor RimP [Cyclobacteriaceae bacterium]
MEIAEKIKELAQSHLQDAAHFVVDVILSKHKPYKVTVILDGDHGINIDDCTELSRKLSESLDSLDLISDNYTLEVGTPGLDQPLKLKRQFIKNVGRELKVTKKDKSILQGKLMSADADKIVLIPSTKEKSTKSKKMELVEIEINFSDIEKATVMVSFK